MSEKHLTEETYARLKPRELQYLRMVGRGMAAKAIAGELGLSHRTIEQGLADARGKLGVSKSAEAAHLVLRYEERPPTVEVRYQPPVVETLEFPRSSDVYTDLDELPEPLAAGPSERLLREMPLAFEAVPAGIGRTASPWTAPEREVELGTHQRLLRILVWMVAPPMVLAALVTCYVGLTMIGGLMSSSR